MPTPPLTPVKAGLTAGRGRPRRPAPRRDRFVAGRVVVIGRTVGGSHARRFAPKPQIFGARRQGSSSARQGFEREEHAADQRAEHGAVDADVLQVRADLGLEAGVELLRLPAGDDVGDVGR